jgi:hypothetical protein
MLLAPAIPAVVAVVVPVYAVVAAVAHIHRDLAQPAAIRDPAVVIAAVAIVVVDLGDRIAVPSPPARGIAAGFHPFDHDQAGMVPLHDHDPASRRSINDRLTHDHMTSHGTTPDHDSRLNDLRWRG